MKIDIVNIINKPYIQVKYSHGNFIGKWMDKNVPNSGTFDVKILLTEIVKFEIIDEKYHIGNSDGKNIICGLIVKENEDFTQLLDIGDKFIIMTDIKEKMLENKFIKLEVDEIELYPIYY